MKNYKKIRDEVYKIVEEAAYSPRNKFTAAWKHHILPVTRHSLTLGKKMKADLKVLELAALLHDYASILDPSFVKNHHVHGARLAGEVLKKLKVSPEKVKVIQNCIMSHRGSIKSERKSIEEKILASADAMSHFTELASMFYLAYGVHKLKTKEGAQWLKGKLERSWAKIMPEGKDMVRKDYLVAMKILRKALER